MRNDRFKERVVVVAGANHPVAKRFGDAVAAEGGVVVLIDEDASELQRTSAHIRLAGGKALPIVADPSDPGSLQDLVDRVSQANGAVDVMAVFGDALLATPLLNALPAAPGARLVLVGDDPRLPETSKPWARANGVAGASGDPSRISPLVMFLASDESGLLNGVVLPCGEDGPD